MAIRVNEATDLVDTFGTELSVDLMNAEAGEYARKHMNVVYGRSRKEVSD